MFIRIIGLFLLLAISGCQILGDNDEGSLLLETNGADFLVGDDLRLTLINGSSNSYTVHPELCGARLQIWKNDGWYTIDGEGFCTLIGLDLNPGQRTQTTRNIDPELESGSYRYEYSIRVYNGETVERTSTREEIFVRTQRFEINR